MWARRARGRTSQKSWSSSSTQDLNSRCSSLTDGCGLCQLRETPFSSRLPRFTTKEAAALLYARLQASLRFMTQLMSIIRFGTMAKIKLNQLKGALFPLFVTLMLSISSHLQVFLGRYSSLIKLLKTQMKIAKTGSRISNFQLSPAI